MDTKNFENFIDKKAQISYYSVTKSIPNSTKSHTNELNIKSLFSLQT